MTTSLESNSGTHNVSGHITLQEIRQQPDIWGTTLERVLACPDLTKLRTCAAIICGAGTSAYASSAVALAWPKARAIPTTDLLVLSKQELIRMFPDFAKSGVLVSLARSGDSPESVGVVARVQKMFSEVMHLAITCNEKGRLANMPGVTSIVLDARTNDRSLVMTGSFSNLVLAGLAVEHADFLAAHLPSIATNARHVLPELESIAQRVAARKPSRVVVLTSPAMAPFGQEVGLKLLEMTAGQVVTLSETYLGLRHGPMSYLRADTLVLCVLSTAPKRLPYELDLIRELREKRLGHFIVVGKAASSDDLVHQLIPAVAPEIADELRTPFEIIFPQLLGYHLSLGSGLDPDNPSPSGVITRVVRNFQLHERDAV